MQPIYAQHNKKKVNNLSNLGKKKKKFWHQSNKKKKGSEKMCS